MKKRRSIIVLLGMIMAGVAVAGFGAPAYAAESAPDTAIAAEVVQMSHRLPGVRP